MCLSYLILITVFTTAQAQTSQTMILSINSDDFEVFPEFSDVETFSFNIEIDMPLAAGAYINPPIISMDYAVNGTLADGTPSGFPAFALMRPSLDEALSGIELNGDEFYTQGSSLNFEILESADLSDGVQADELVGTSVILSLNAREEGTGRFHPPLFELNSDGTGSIQNSNNIPDTTQAAVTFGAEYITNVIFDSGNLTLITEIDTETTIDTPDGESSGGGSMSWFVFVSLSLLGLLRKRRISKSSN